MRKSTKAVCDITSSTSDHVLNHLSHSVDRHAVLILHGADRVPAASEDLLLSVPCQSYNKTVHFYHISGIKTPEKENSNLIRAKILYHRPLSPPSFFSPRNIRTMTFRFSLCGFDNLMWNEKSLWFNLLYLRDDLCAIWMRTSSRYVTRLLSGKSSEVVKISFTAIPPDKAKSLCVYL